MLGQLKKTVLLLQFSNALDGVSPVEELRTSYSAVSRNGRRFPKQKRAIVFPSVLW